MGRQSIETLLAQMYNNEVEVSLGRGRWVEGVKGNDEGVVVGFVSFTRGRRDFLGYKIVSWGAE